jgi:hypothetical protein
MFNVYSTEMIYKNTRMELKRYLEEHYDFPIQWAVKEYRNAYVG